MIEFNETVLFKEYKNIFKTCITDGYPIPTLILTYNIPSEYLFEDNELNQILSGLSEKNRSKLASAYKERRVKELDIFRNTRGKNKIREKVDAYHINELKGFITEYPLYEDIIL